MLVAFLVACAPPPPEPGAPPEEALVTPAGGVFSTNGASFLVPPLAVAEDTSIAIVPTALEVPAGVDALTAVWRMEPEGLELDWPVLVVLPVTEPVEHARFHQRDEGGSWPRLEAFADGDVVAGEVTRLAPAVVGRAQQVSTQIPALLPSLDLLLVVDNSVGMEPAIERLQDALLDVLPELADRAAQVGVTTADMVVYDDAPGAGGNLLSYGTRRFAVANAIDGAEQMVEQVGLVVTNEVAFEQHRDVAYTLLGARHDAPENAGFLRQGSLIDVVLVSGSSDASSLITGSGLASWVHDDLTGIPGDARVHGLFGDVELLPSPEGPEGTCSNPAGPVGWIAEGGGVQQGLCTDGYASFLQTILDQHLERVRVATPFSTHGTITGVSVAGVALAPADWSRHGAWVVFDGAVEVPPGSLVTVEGVD